MTYQFMLKKLRGKTEEQIREYLEANGWDERAMRRFFRKQKQIGTVK